MVLTRRNISGTTRGRKPSSAACSCGEPVCKPGSVRALRAACEATIHLGRASPHASSGLPASIGRAALERSRGLLGGRCRFALLLDLAPGGVYRAARVTPGAGGLLPRRFTLTAPSGDGAAVCFLWHFPAGHPGLVLPTTLPCGARTFLGTGSGRARGRPTGSPHGHSTAGRGGRRPVGRAARRRRGGPRRRRPPRRRGCTAR
jgi:hypothetical protein